MILCYLITKEGTERERRAKISERENVGNRYTEKLETCQLIDTSLKQPERVTTKLATTFNTNRTYVSQAQKLKETAPEKYEQAKRGETQSVTKSEDAMQQLIVTQPKNRNVTDTKLATTFNTK